MNEYQGKELELFDHARNWKMYFGSFMKPFLKGDVLEVGAGTGGTTKVLCDGNQLSWTCLEPDERQLLQIRSLIDDKRLPYYCKAVGGTIADATLQKAYDTILYIDVIEHIKNDKEEILRASKLLKDDGALIILVPAHNWLYSNFDKAIGHYRRYNMKMIRAIKPASMKEEKIFYLDSLGVMASLANKYILKNTYPTQNQIYFWDKFIVPVSRGLDFITRKFLGRSLVFIARKTIQ
jgi:SAM-dependent methyltransferase